MGRKSNVKWKYECQFFEAEGEQEGGLCKELMTTCAWGLFGSSN